MTDGVTPDPAGDGPAAVGFGLLMAGVEAAVASAAEQIAALGFVVQQGFAGTLAHTPPTLLPPSPAARAAAPLPARRAEAASSEAATEDAAPPSMTGACAVGSELPRGMGTPPTGTPMPGATMPLGEVPNDRPPSGNGPLPPPATGGAATRELAAPLAPGVEPPIGLPTAGAAGEAGRPQPALETAPTLAVPTALAQPVAAAGMAPAAVALPWRQAPADPPALPLPRHAAASVAPALAVPDVAMGGDADVPAGAVQGASLAPSRAGEQSLAPVGRGVESASSPSSAGGPTHGDVILDGVLVGHWIADVLARSAGGPARGGTGFDARMGPRWPGTLQGR